MDQMIDRIDERLAAVGLTDRAASIQATGKADTIRDIRRKGTKPKQEALAGLAEVLETTTEYLLHGRETGHVVGDRRTGYEPQPDPVPFSKTPARSLPVFGTVLGSEVSFDDTAIETHMIELTEEIDWVRRPPILESRRDVYAVYISGHSMEPRFEPGDPVIVDPKRAPKPGDDVIVQLTTDGETVATALIKRLVRQSSNYVELRQYNPPKVFRVDRERVKWLHRVLSMGDVIG